MSAKTKQMRDKATLTKIHTVNQFVSRLSSWDSHRQFFVVTDWTDEMLCAPVACRKPDVIVGRQ